MKLSELVSPVRNERDYNEALARLLTEKGIETSDIEAVEQPVKQWKTLTNSRELVLKNGTRVRVLDVLAALKFSAEERLGKTAVWKDRNWKNETMSNVELRDQPSGRPFGSKLAPGMRAGTKEYYKARYASRREEIRAYHKRRYWEGRETERKSREQAEYGQFSQHPSEEDLAIANALRQGDEARIQDSFERALEAMRKSGKTSEATVLTLGDIAKSSE